jgi:uncharacterized membrane protein YkvA (DUF1232 family)
MLEQLKSWARHIRRDVLAVYLAIYDKRVPWYVKALAAVVAGYALSPIDLIPDFIPVIGYLDDLLLVPLGILLVIYLIPTPVLDDLRQQATLRIDDKTPKSITAAIVIVCIWIILAAGAAMLLFRAFT